MKASQRVVLWVYVVVAAVLALARPWLDHRGFAGWAIVPPGGCSVDWWQYVATWFGVTLAGVVAWFAVKISDR
jgi:hypothetical protein